MKVEKRNFTWGYKWLWNGGKTYLEKRATEICSLSGSKIKTCQLLSETKKIDLPCYTTSYNRKRL